MPRLVIFIICLLLLGLISCDSYSRSAEKRTQQALDGKGDIIIGIVDNSTNPSQFLDGVQLAVKEINEGGGLFGRKIQPLIYDDKGDLARARVIANKLAHNHNVIAVIGHRQSDIAIFASIIYEQSGILFISHGATHPNLTRYGGKYTFRNIPNDEELGRQIAILSHQWGGKKGVVFYEREDSFRRLADVFTSESSNLGIKTISTRSFFKWEQEFRDILSDIRKREPFDGIFIAGSLPVSAIVIKQARELGISEPIVGGTEMDSPELLTIAGRSAESAVVTTVFNPEHPDRETRDFVKRFNDKYGVVPDTWAAQGYDAVSVLAEAIKQCGSLVPINIASSLRFLEDWHGVTGPYSFTSDGDVKDKRVFFKIVQNGKFEFMDFKKPDEPINPLYVVEDKTIRIPVEGDIYTIDPSKTEDMASIEVIEQLFLGLTDFDPVTYQPVPELASDWTVSEDGLVYTFNLRQDAKWTDGSSVTAHDIVWTVQRNIKPETDCPYVFVMYILKNAQLINQGDITDVSLLGVRAVNDYTVEFTLEHPATYFPALAGLWPYRPLPRRAIEIYGENWTAPENIQSNGSYKLAYWARGMVMILQKNPNYYDAHKVRIEEVRYYSIPQSSVGYSMYRNHELDIMGSIYLRLPFAEIPNIRSDPKLRDEYSQQPQFSVYSYWFNFLRPTMQNTLVRKAISAAIDRQLIVDIITRGGAEAATTFARPPIFGAVDPKERIGITFNPEQAKKWLTEAGYPDGKGFPTITLWHPSSEIHSQLAQTVRISLSHYLNIQIQIEEREFHEFLKTTSGPDNPADIFQFGWFADYPDANNFLNELFHPVKSSNRSGWDNQEFGELMDQAEKSADPEKRKALYRRAEQILCEEVAAVVPIYFEIAHCLVKPRVKNWYHMAIGGQHIRNWYFEK